MRKNLFFFFLLVFLMVSQATFAQKIDGSASIGGSAYLGDLVQGAPAFKQISPAVSIGATTSLAKQFKARLDLSILGARGDDKLNKNPNYSTRNLNFKTTIWELALLGQVDFINPDKHVVVPYIFLGPSLYHFNPTTKDRSGNKVDLHDIGTEGQLLGIATYADRKYNLTQLNLQLGAGISYKINERVSLGFELSFRKLFTDYLDDVSTSYPTLSEFAAAGQQYAAGLSFRGDEIGQPNNDVKNFPRGNPDEKDLYYTFQFRGVFKLNKNAAKSD